MKSNPQTELEELNRWFVSRATLLESPAGLLQELCERLVGMDVPVQRVTLIVFVLHPLIHGMTFRWENGEFESMMHRHGLEHAPAYLKSPILAMREGRIDRLHRSLEGDDELEYPVLTELREKGLTDYLLLPMRFSEGGTQCLSLATSRAGGFEKRELEIIDAIVPLVTVATELIVQKTKTERLLETYLGRDASRQVLAGQIKRGDGQNIHSVVLICDLRGFTRISEQHERPILLELLDAYFELVVDAIREQGGEVLKFIGDAVLAVFRSEDGGAALACQRAAQASRAAHAAARTHNARRREEAKLEIEFGMAMHVGEVMYGNIGSPDRLDFTVIGPAVNKASRIEGLSSVLNRPVLVSEEFAALYEGELDELGKHQLKGIDTPANIYALNV